MVLRELRRDCKEDYAAAFQRFLWTNYPEYGIDFQALLRHNKIIIIGKGVTMIRRNAGEDKLAALRSHHALNPHPEAVTDPAFVAGGDFFDARDRVQVKYEMLRRVGREGQAVTQTAASFGFSRPAFYQAQKSFEFAGLPGLLPQRPGPRRAHKLTEEVVAFLQRNLAGEPGLGARELARRLQESMGILVHRRTIERGLARHQKKPRGQRS